MMRAGTVLLLLATIAWARDCPFCEKPMVAVRVKEAVHSFCRSCSGTVHEAPDGTATASVRVRGERRTFILPSADTISRRHWEIVRMGDLEPNATEGREGGSVAPGHPITRPGHPVTRPGHPVNRPGHPVALPGHAVKRPCHSVKRPAHAVKRPAHAVKRPSHSVKRPAHAVKRPAHAVKRPSHPVSRPAHAIKRPGHPVTRPGHILTNTPRLPLRTDGPALLVAPRKWSPPARRAPARRYS
jgi:hypothetical protein